MSGASSINKMCTVIQNCKCHITADLHGVDLRVASTSEARSQARERVRSQARERVRREFEEVEDKRDVKDLLSSLSSGAFIELFHGKS